MNTKILLADDTAGRVFAIGQLVKHGDNQGRIVGMARCVSGALIWARVRSSQTRRIFRAVLDDLDPA